MANLSYTCSSCLTVAWQDDKHSHMSRVLLLTLAVGISQALVNAKDLDHTFKKIQVTDQFWSEGADIGDFNKDGNMDVVAGPFWYEGPDFKKRHEIWPATASFTRKKADGTSHNCFRVSAPIWISGPRRYSRLAVRFAISMEPFVNGWCAMLSTPRTLTRRI